MTLFSLVKIKFSELIKKRKTWRYEEIKLTPSILARFIHKITVKADGQLEVHYRTSKPSAFYVSTNSKLAIPKTHPSIGHVKKYGYLRISQLVQATPHTPHARYVGIGRQVARF